MSYGLEYYEGKVIWKRDSIPKRQNLMNMIVIRRKL